MILTDPDGDRLVIDEAVDTEQRMLFLLTDQKIDDKIHLLSGVNLTVDMARQLAAYLTAFVEGKG